jgi:hypothetical protein
MSKGSLLGSGTVNMFPLQRFNMQQKRNCRFSRLRGFVASITDGRDLLKYAVEMSSGGMIYKSKFHKDWF